MIGSETSIISLAWEYLKVAILDKVKCDVTQFVLSDGKSLAESPETIRYILTSFYHVDVSELSDNAALGLLTHSLLNRVSVPVVIESSKQEEVINVLVESVSEDVKYRLKSHVNYLGAASEVLSSESTNMPSHLPIACVNTNYIDDNQFDETNVLLDTDNVLELSKSKSNIYTTLSEYPNGIHYVLYKDDVLSSITDDTAYNTVLVIGEFDNGVDLSSEVQARCVMFNKFVGYVALPEYVDEIRIYDSCTPEVLDSISCLYSLLHIYIQDSMLEELVLESSSVSYLEIDSSPNLVYLDVRSCLDLTKLVVKGEGESLSEVIASKVLSEGSELFDIGNRYVAGVTEVVFI